MDSMNVAQEVFAAVALLIGLPIVCGIVAGVSGTLITPPDDRHALTVLGAAVVSVFGFLAGGVIGFCIFWMMAA